MLHKKTLSDVAIDVFVYIFLTLLAISTLFPFLNVFSKSVSEEWAVVSGKVGIYPMGFQLDTMKYVITSSQFINSFSVSVFITLTGTVFSILLSALTAYPLSKKNIPGVKIILVLFVFTMLFNGGLIPNYMLIKNLGLINKLGALILPGLINVFNLLLLKNYYESLPESLEESAKLDGASNLTILFKIILPVSLPVLATVSLFYAVSYWNDFFNAMLYVTKPTLKPLQLYLRDIVIDADNTAAGMNKSAEDMLNVSSEGVRAATIIASTVPIIMVYPFLQKYFIKGVMVGSVKG